MSNMSNVKVCHARQMGAKFANNAEIPHFIGNFPF